MTTLRIQFVLPALISGAMAVLPPRSASAQPAPPRPSVFQTTLEEANQKTPEITTEQLQAILATNSEPVFDVRFAKEYAIAHIPGTINIFEKEVERIVERHPDLSTPMILYCNGPSCGKSKRTSEQLVMMGYTNVRRYQLGMPVWRALSQTVQTDMLGVQYIYAGDRTAVWVDARTPAEVAAGSIARGRERPGGRSGCGERRRAAAVTGQRDARGRVRDDGTAGASRGRRNRQTSLLEQQLFWRHVQRPAAAGLINHRPVVVSRNVALAAGAACTAMVQAADIDNGSYDPDSGDSLTLAVGRPDRSASASTWWR